MIFAADDLGRFLREGWVVARGVVPEEHRRAAIEALCAFHGTRPDDPESWYRAPPEACDVVPVHHAQAFWDVRQLPRVHRAFAELLGTERLWVTMDRGAFKPPVRPDRDPTGPFHWDGDPRARLAEPAPSVQGVVYLTDCGEDQGAFECVPSLFRDARSWFAAHPTGEEPDVTGHPIVRVPGEAGDLVIWNQLLPHRAGCNRGPSPRLTRYVAMFPAGTPEEAAERVRWWRERRVPPWWRAWPPTVVDPEPGEPARLDPLGRRLVGLDPWPAR